MVEGATLQALRRIIHKLVIMNLSPPRGTRDFPPGEFRLRNWLFDHFRKVSALFGFEEYDAPVVESEDLYTRKAGEEIVDQLYTFEDKSGRKLALRPEMTPSLARLVLQKGGALPLPIKWFSIPQCWRYERMTRGRRREHFQWNLDIFGVADVSAEAELLAAIVTFFTQVGLSADDVQIRVSNRRILQAVLQDAGVPDEQFGPVCILVDKLEKLPREEVSAQVKALGIAIDVVDRILEIGYVRSIDDIAAVVDEERSGLSELRRLFTLAGHYGIAEWLVFDPSLARGLAYYTGTVFEAFDRSAGLRAICGGGRYDRLLSTFGGKDIPACGFGFGDAVIEELLREKGLLPEPQPAIDDVVFSFDADLREPAMAIAAALRRQGRSVDLVLEDGRKMKWAFRRADQAGATRIILVAPDEWSRGQVRVRHLASGEETDVPVEELHADVAESQGT